MHTFRLFANTLRKVDYFWHEQCDASWRDFILLCCLMFTVLLLITSFTVESFHNKLPIYLAQAFLHGKTYLEADVMAIGDIGDTAWFENRVYWPGGPMLGVASIPFVLLGGTGFSLAHINLFYHLTVLVLLYQLTKACGVKSSIHRLIFSLGFIGATNFSGLVANQFITPYVQQIITVTFILLALILFIRRQHPLFIGIAVAAAFLTRFTLIGLIPLYPLTLLSERPNRQIATKLGWYSLAILLGLGVALGYNQIRFHNVLENGYRYQTTDTQDVFRSDIEAKGIFNLEYLPANAYYLLLKMPELVMAPTGNHAVFPYLRAYPWGMSILVTSPFLILYIFRTSKYPWVRWMKYCSAIVLAPMLVYYGIGWIQYGYRYAIDVYPMLFCITIVGSEGKITPNIFRAIIIGMFCTWWFLLIPFP